MHHCQLLLVFHSSLHAESSQTGNLHLTRAKPGKALCAFHRLLAMQCSMATNSVEQGKAAKSVTQCMLCQSILLRLPKCAYIWSVPHVVHSPQELAVAGGVRWLAASDFTVCAAQLEGVAGHPGRLWILPAAATNTCTNSINLLMVITKNIVLEAAIATNTL